MMQMLAAGGMKLLTDFERKPDEDNPRGYSEWEPAKLLPKQPELIDQAEGKAVKVISQLLLSLPPGRDYKVIFMERAVAEVLASQDEMLRRRGSSDSVSHEVMSRTFEQHLNAVRAWFKKRADISVCWVQYKLILEDPASSSSAIQEFLARDLNLEAMVGQVDPALYRNRLP
jgi:hypothetical protein